MEERDDPIAAVVPDASPWIARGLALAAIFFFGLAMLQAILVGRGENHAIGAFISTLAGLCLLGAGCRMVGAAGAARWGLKGTAAGALLIAIGAAAWLLVHVAAGDPVSGEAWSRMVPIALLAPIYARMAWNEAH